MLLLCRVPVASSAKLQLAGEVGLYVANQELGHPVMLSMIVGGTVTFVSDTETNAALLGRRLPRFGVVVA
jgi:hypothetical protein